MTIHLVFPGGYRGQIDEQDYPLFAAHNWVVFINNRRPYLVRYETQAGRSKKIWFHRVVMIAGDGQTVDHADMDGLNNTRRNLRFCSVSQNTRNCNKRSSSAYPFKGINRRHNKYRALITIQGRRIQEFGFDTPEEAARAYDRLPKKYFGEFARLNFPDEDCAVA